jgi:threonine dehydrogenase-like Zn-dependent dehydrogenase
VLTTNRSPLPEVSGLAADGGTGTVPFAKGDQPGATFKADELRRKPAATRRISIFGLGYVGAVSLACLARDGHRVIGVDIDPVKLDLIRSRKSPILEEGIQELMRDVVDSGRVTVTHDAAQALRDTELLFVCVGTPSAPNGSQDLGGSRSSWARRSGTSASSTPS